MCVTAWNHSFLILSTYYIILLPAVIEVNKRDIVFLVDGTSTRGPANFNAIRDFIYKVIQKLEIGQDLIQVAVAQYSHTVKPEFYFKDFQTRRDVLSAVRRLRPLNGTALYTGAALDHIRNNFFNSSVGYRAAEGVPKLLVLITGGKSLDDIRQPAQELKRSGIMAFSIGSPMADRTELEEVAFDSSLVFIPPEFRTGPLQAILPGLLAPLRTLSGITQENKRDILFLLDGSANLVGQFPAVRDFLYKIIDELDVKPDGTRIAVAQYSDNVKIESRFSEHQNKGEILNIVKRMKIKTGKPLNMGYALDLAQRDIFVKSSGSRIEEGVPQFLVLLAAGRSTDRVDVPAQNLRQVGIIPFIFQAKNADAAELERIVPSPAFILSVESLPKIGELQPQIVNLLKTVQNGGPPQGEKKDVVFLIDGSEAVRSGFSLLKEFVQRVVESLDVGPDRVRVAVVQFSERARPEFYLNSYSDQQAVVSAIRRLTLLGGLSLNTGSALDFVMRNMLVESAGSRITEGVPQFLIVLSASRSRDDVRGPSVVLKRSGAVPFGIRIGHDDDTEMRTISYIPDFAVVIPTFQQLGSVQQVISEKVTLLSRAELDKITPVLTLSPTGVSSKRDVVFLIDGSQNTVQEFSYIRSLIERLVEDLDVGFDTTRVAVIQFSEDPRVEFLLNAYTSKDEVQTAVRRLRPKGGRQINVGSALDYVSKNIFRRPLGSRIEEGVPQFLVLVSSGRSDDEVEDSAVQIKQSGVAPFTVARNADPEELVKISLSPEYVFSVSTFRELPSLEQKLLTPITTLTSEQIQSLLTRTQYPPPVVENDAADIIFLIDSSDSVRQDGLAHIRDFIGSIVRKLNIGPNRVRIGVLQFSNDVFPEFYLKTHKSQAAVLDAIRRLRFRGGSPLNTGKALDFVAKNFFVKSAGSRIEDGVPQHLVLFLGGKSQDDVSRSSRVIGSAGIVSVGVGSRNVDRAELQTITNNDRLIFTVRDFRDLRNIESQVINSFGPSGVTPTPPGPFSPSTPVAKKADIVFLLDGSINFRRDDFREVLRFASGIVDTIYEGGDSIQVGLVQYNSDPTDEFFLKDFSTKEEIVDAINKVVYKGGREANTFVGLDHLRKNHFVPEAGSRIDQRIPQIAFVITGGSSVEDTEEATRALSQKGVKVFAVGVKNIDLGEVSKIASNSAIAFRVTNVQELSELSEQVLETLHDAMHETLCPGMTDVSRACHLDVILGFDGSQDQNVFVSQRGLESKVDAVLNRITQLQRISCTGSQEPTVRVAAVAYTPSGPVEGFDFSEFQPDLFEKFQSMRNQHPYLLTPDTLKVYQNKFRSSPAGSVKVVIHFTDGVDGSLAELQKASAELQEEGVNALIFVGLERVANYDNVMQLEFGRGFTYNRPLTVNLMDLDYELAEQLDSIAERACCGVPCKCSGQRGDRGLLGSVGPKGMPGEDGYRGYPGDEGGPGERGPPGVNGTQGFQGCPGQRGTKISLRILEALHGFKDSAPRTCNLHICFAALQGNSGPPGGVGQKGDPGYPGPSWSLNLALSSSQEIKCFEKHCLFSAGPLECPVFPTELAFALDTSQGVSQDTFSRMRDALLRIVNNMTIAESNCPRGARVAVVTYNNEVTTEIRFPDSKRKSQLLDRIRNLQVPLTSKERSLETAMSFVARNTFKRARSGFLMRKVAVFFSNGLVQASPLLSEAVLKLSDAGITPLFLTSTEDRALINALQINNTAVGHALVLPPPRNLNEFLKNVFLCHVCLDICNPDPSCGFDSVRPSFRDRRAAGSDVDIDMAFILDSSETTTPFAFNEMKKYITYMVKQLEISPDPKMSQHLTRVAVLQHAPWEHEMNTSVPPVRVELSLTDYGSKDKLVDFLSNHMTLLPGTRALGNAIEYTIESIFESAPNPRDLKIVVLVVTGEVKKAELDDLQRIIVQAKCKGYFFVVLGIGRKVNVKDVYGFASEPNDVFFKLADKPTELNEEPLLRFARLLPSFVNSENAFYLSPDVRKQCDWFQGDQPAKNPIKFGQRQIHVPNNATSISTSKPVTTTKLTTSAASEKQTPAKVAPASPAAANPPSVKQAPASPAAANPPSVKQAPASPAAANPPSVKQAPASPAAANPAPVKQAPASPAAANPAPVKQAPVKQAPASPAAANLPSVKQAPANPAAVARPVASKPATTKPAAAKSVAMKPVTTKPLAMKPQATKPLSPKPAGMYGPRTPRPTCAEAALGRTWKNLPELLRPSFKTSREIQVSEVTENSARLRWVNPDQPNPYIYDLTVTSMHDRSVVLKQNLTMTERVIGGLVAGHTYHVAIVSYLKSQVKATYEGTFTTKKIQSPPPQPPKAASSATLNLMVNSEPWKGMDAGTCRKFNLKWFYDPETKSCGRFWYSGCGSNGNNFETQSDCEKACLPGEWR
uniref:Collagen type VI alpha 3 chain n=1 Tax=Vombatus ursinus TaxID=29139 RepID=A0A4X2LYE3_VOMUR